METHLPSPSPSLPPSDKRRTTNEHLNAPRQNVNQVVLLLPREQNFFFPQSRESWRRNYAITIKCIGFATTLSKQNTAPTNILSEPDGCKYPTLCNPKQTHEVKKKKRVKKKMEGGRKSVSHKVKFRLIGAIFHAIISTQIQKSRE